MKSTSFMISEPTIPKPSLKGFHSLCKNTSYWCDGEQCLIVIIILREIKAMCASLSKMASKS